MINLTPDAIKICQKAKTDPHLLVFILESMDRIGGQTKRHLTGTELSLAIRDYARDQFGALALPVFHQWGIYTTKDIGEAVFRLIDNGLLGKSDEDKIEDFIDVFSLDEELNMEKYMKSLYD